jgi:RimJ/RimL family protein N-acetyltransferase
MDLVYFKRYRMEIDLRGRDWTPVPPPPGYRFVPWDSTLLDAFAKAKYYSFRNEIDANVFPCLGGFDGCRRLMMEIVRKPGFLPEATWLLTYAPRPAARAECCGTVQGVRDRAGVGAIQNVGIAPDHRGAGLGTKLLHHALGGFRRAGMNRVYLEVTAQNEGAIRFYHRMGFTTVKTVYKAVEAVYS